jgi:hypothetical protein
MILTLFKNYCDLEILKEIDKLGFENKNSFYTMVIEDVYHSKINKKLSQNIYVDINAQSNVIISYYLYSEDFFDFKNKKICNRFIY